MTKQDEHQPPDQALDDLGRRYRRASTESPPDLVDLAIRNRAHLAVERDSTRRGQPLWRWVPAAASALVVVLALGLVMENWTRAPKVPADSPGNGPIQLESVDYDTVADQLGREPESDSEPAAEADYRAQREELQKQERRLLQMKRDRQELQRKTAKSSPATAPPATTAPAEGLDEITVTGSRVKREDLEAPQPITELEQSEETASAEVADDVPEPAMEALAEAPALHDPEDWLRDILRWRRMGLNDRFERELDAFLETYPDYELPEELKAYRSN